MLIVDVILSKAKNLYTIKRTLSIILSVCLAAAALVSCGSTEGLYPKKGKTVRIVTYNVGVFAKWDGSGIPVTAALMKELAPDVIALQELDSCARRTGNVYQVEAFAREMGENWGYAYAPALKPFQGGAYGVGQVWNNDVKKPVDSFSIRLPKGKGSETRALTVVEYEDMVFAGTHLDHRNDSSQLAQAMLVTETLQGRYADSGKPVFLCGDFNAYPDSRTLAYFREHWTVLNSEKTTYPEWKKVKEMETAPATIGQTPGFCIDYILILNNGVEYEVTAADTCVPFESGNVFESSDHLPVYVDIRF